jgi:hypothetical protein
MRTKLVSYLHICFGGAGLVMLAVYFPTRGTSGDSLAWAGILAAPFLALIVLGIGLAGFPQPFTRIVRSAHWALIALTICAILLFLGLAMRSQGSGWLIVIITVPMVFLSLFSGLTLLLLGKTKSTQNQE